MEESTEKYVLRWQVPESLGKTLPKGIIPIEGRKYTGVKAQFSTVRKLSFPDGRRGYENLCYKKTRIFFDDARKIITIESPSERGAQSWAGELELKLHHGD